MKRLLAFQYSKFSGEDALLLWFAVSFPSIAYRHAPDSCGTGLMTMIDAEDILRLLLWLPSWQHNCIPSCVDLSHVGILLPASKKMATSWILTSRFALLVMQFLAFSVGHIEHYQSHCSMNLTALYSNVSAPNDTTVRAADVRIFLLIFWYNPSLLISLLLDFARLINACTFPHLIGIYFANSSCSNSCQRAENSSNCLAQGPFTPLR